MGLVLKVLLVVGVVLVVGWTLLGRGRSLRRPAPHESAPEAGRPRPDAGSQAMVTCARCGVHLPASEAVMAGLRAYCSAEHRDGDRTSDRAA